MTLLDLYSGCGAMSTGLCIGAKRSGINLVTVSQLMRYSFDLLYNLWFVIRDRGIFCA